ncbi:hypothetical protein [Xanthomonas sacchari]|uniref:hypothetical protein n=1 Tax=Xanthomonas sacchari TaxID=56458 RepID=UPI0022542975|nr:hypothetical protein [Xanthomonas sacchari]
MAENEIIDMGHASRWVRTRKALKDSSCSVEDIAAAMGEDMEGMCAALNGALRNGPPLSQLLRLSLGSPLQVQAVIAQFTEKGLVNLVNSARNLCRSSDPLEVSRLAARLLTQRLVDQAECRAGREERFRDPALRNELCLQATKVFGGYEADLRAMLEAALRDGAPVPFKRRLTARPRMSSKQLVGMSLTAPRPQPPTETGRAR